jgi:hypothetical protein
VRKSFQTVSGRGILRTSPKRSSPKFVVKANPLLNLVRESLKVVARDTKFIADSSN